MIISSLLLDLSWLPICAWRLFTSAPIDAYAADFDTAFGALETGVRRTDFDPSVALDAVV